MLLHFRFEIILYLALFLCLSIDVHFPFYATACQDPLSEAGNALTHIDQENVAESLLAGNRSVI